MTAAAKRAGINPATSAHWLRHAHASHAIDGGAPITLVSQPLGHADLKTTSVYAHARPNAARAGISRGRKPGPLRLAQELAAPHARRGHHEA